MSTVLKAVQEIERRATPLASSTEPHDVEDRRPWALIVVGVAGIGILAAVAANLAPLGSGQVETSAPVVAAAPPPARGAAEPPHVPAPPVAPAHAAVEPPPVATVAAAAPPLVEEEAPRGEVVLDTSVPAAPRALAKAAVRAEVPEARPRKAAVERKQRVAAVAPPPPVEDESFAVDEPIVPEPAPKRAGTATSPLPRVDVRAIAYANNPEARTVTLRIGGGSAVTMHEGESMSGVDVQLILPDSVYLRHGGSIFALGR
jgi:hypothetical protein